MRSFILSCFIVPMLLALFPGCKSEEEQEMNVLLILIDTMSADHLGCYGYDRNTSPTIDSLAASGMLFANCQAQAPWTLPSMVTICTGLSERSHRCSHYDGFSHGLDPEMPTLASILQERGYHTAAFVNNGYLGEIFGLERGYHDFWISEVDGGADAGVTVDTLLSYLSGTSVSEPFLVTVHFFDPHLPYAPPSPYDTLFTSAGTDGMTEWPVLEQCTDSSVIQHMAALYDSEIRWTDSQLSRLLAGMREMDMTDNTLLVLVSDHGEEFMEHGDWGHAHNLYQQALHVPLILSGPGIEPGSVVPQNVGQFDVMPTILGLLHLPVPDHVDGIDLFGGIPEDRMIPSSGVLAETTSVSCLQESRKVIWFIEPDSSETYDLSADPGELSILPFDSLLLGEVMGYWAWPSKCTPTENEEAIISARRLQDLGYIR